MCFSSGYGGGYAPTPPSPIAATPAKISPPAETATRLGIAEEKRARRKSRAKTGGLLSSLKIPLLINASSK